MYIINKKQLYVTEHDIIISTNYQTRIKHPLQTGEQAPDSIFCINSDIEYDFITGFSNTIYTHLLCFICTYMIFFKQ